MHSLNRKSSGEQMMQRDGTPRVNEQRSYIFRFTQKKRVTFAKSHPRRPAARGNITFVKPSFTN